MYCKNSHLWLDIKEISQYNLHSQCRFYQTHQPALVALLAKHKRIMYKLCSRLTELVEGLHIVDDSLLSLGTYLR